jgi:hypothetical protein
MLLRSSRWPRITLHTPELAAVTRIADLALAHITV